MNCLCRLGARRTRNATKVGFLRIGSVLGQVIAGMVSTAVMDSKLVALPSRTNKISGLRRSTNGALLTCKLDNVNV